LGFGNRIRKPHHLQRSIFFRGTNTQNGVDMGTTAGFLAGCLSAVGMILVVRYGLASYYVTDLFVGLVLIVGAVITLAACEVNKGGPRPALVAHPQE
jgi:hypothetical protein